MHIGRCFLSLVMAGLLIFSSSSGLKAEVLCVEDGCTQIEAGRFEGDQTLDEVVLPEGIRTIGARAFAESSVKKINLPASLEDIAEDAFEGVELARVTVDAGTFAFDWVQKHAIADLLVIQADTWEETADATHWLIQTYDEMIGPQEDGSNSGSARLLVRVEKELPEIDAYHPVCIIVDQQTHFLIQFSDPAEARDCAAYLNSRPGVLYAEKDGVMSVF